MSAFGFTHVNVLQRAVEVAAAFYRSADTAREIEISQHADGGSKHWRELDRGGRSAHHARGPVPAHMEICRIAATMERDYRRDELGRTAAAGAGGRFALYR